MTVHVCEALVITCIDFRFRKYIRTWLEKNFVTSDYDLVSMAGSTREIRSIMRQLDISAHLHHIDRVVIIHHEDCGAYGKHGNKQLHIKDMHQTKTVINALYPDVTVELYYLHLNGKFELIK